MKVITDIEVPERWKITNDWDSHRPLLWLCCKYTLMFLPITEFGCGEGSTKLLFNFKKGLGDNFFSYETNDDYFYKYKKYVTKINNYLDVHLSEQPFGQGLLFIDCAPAEIRKYLIEKHRNHADCLIVHDTEDGAEYVYGMKEILGTFKYRLDFEPKGLPRTTAVSNFVNIEKWI